MGPSGDGAKELSALNQNVIWCENGVVCAEEEPNAGARAPSRPHESWKTPGAEPSPSIGAAGLGP